MNIISNEPAIRRNARIAQFTGLAGLIVLLVGIFLFFTPPEQFAIIWATVLVGFILSQIGIYFTNRWGRRPRPDEHLNLALKGLEGSYSIYHYVTPTSHLLVGPAGVWVLLPRYQRGKITYEKNRWRQRGGGFFLAYMKIFGQEGLGRPDLEIEAETESIRNYLAQKLPEDEIPEIQAALVFTDERAELDVNDAPIPTIYAKKLKEVIRKATKNKPLTNEKVRLIQQAIEADPKAQNSEKKKADSKSREKSKKQAARK
jgi:hypothetical protein